jgi:hypothetical protein
MIKNKFKITLIDGVKVNNSNFNVIEDPLKYPTLDEEYMITEAYNFENGVPDVKYYDVYHDSVLCEWFFMTEDFRIFDNLGRRKVRIYRYFCENNNFEGNFMKVVWL